MTDEDDSAPESPLSDVDRSSESGTDPSLKAALQELIKLGYLEETRKPALFRTVVLHEGTLNQALEPLDFALRLDTHRGIAMLVLRADGEAEIDDEWKHPLIRRQRLTLEQSILVALLREAFLLNEQERGVGQSIAKLAVDDLLPKFLTYFPDSGSDGRNQQRLASILDQLNAHGIVSEIDRNDEITIRPLIVHLANAESLEVLLQTYQSLAEN
ncbi:MAG: DUF4194 domain-containing protein [Verrucomicrobiota bacterium]